MSHATLARTRARVWATATAALATLTLAALALGSCSSADDGAENNADSPTGTVEGSGEAAGDTDTDSLRTLTVFAAASLQGVFTELGEEFEAANPNVEVVFSFAGSSQLVTQLQEGAPADVIATANATTMDQVVTDDLVDTPVTFATNTLTIAVPPGNPAGIGALADLTDDGVRLVICAPQVPCGAATQKVQEAAGLTLQPVSEENSVTDVLTKVISGEADAGLVYVTDVRGAGDQVEEVSFAESSEAVNTYPIAVLHDAAEPDFAQQFVDLVTSEGGQSVLSAAGFAAP